jgi:hypothetical protein
MMTPIQNFPKDVAKILLVIFFDIDDTFTTRGKIGPKPFQAIWSLKEAGLKVVPITGRPAGWCDQFPSESRSIGWRTGDEFIRSCRRSLYRIEPNL